MQGISIGDAAQQFISARNGASIKTDLNRLAQSLSSGNVGDISKAMNGDTTRVSGLQYSLERLEAYESANKETAQYLDAVQTVLSQVQSERGAVAERLLLVSDSSTNAQIDEAAFAARGSLKTVITALNTQLGDRALMGGAVSDRPPLATADEMLADMQLTLGGATDAATIISTVNAWFDDPAGGFATSGYVGDTGTLAQKRVSDTKAIAMTARADDAAIVEVLKGAAISALADQLTGPSYETKSELLQYAGQQLFAVANDLTFVQARVGNSQENLAQTMAESASQSAAISMQRNDLIRIDPFETATKLQSVQLQLETHYTVTARLSGLSLLRYL